MLGNVAPRISYRGYAALLLEFIPANALYTAGLASASEVVMGTSYDLNDAREIEQDVELEFLTMAKEIAY
jgi:hypothetical protein